MQLLNASGEYVEELINRATAANNRRKRERLAKEAYNNFVALSTSARESDGEGNAKDTVIAALFTEYEVLKKYYPKLKRDVRRRYHALSIFCGTYYSKQHTRVS